MSTHTAPIEGVLTSEQSLLTDHIGNEVYASHYAERKAYRLLIGCGTILFLGSMWLNLSLARRPIANRYIRIDGPDGAMCAQVVTTWVLIEQASGRPRRVPGWMVEMFA